MANWGSNTVNAIDTATNEVIATVTVNYGPKALGQFIVSPSNVVTNGTNTPAVVPTAADNNTLLPIIGVILVIAGLLFGLLFTSLTTVKKIPISKLGSLRKI